MKRGHAGQLSVLTMLADCSNRLATRRHAGVPRSRAASRAPRLARVSIRLREVVEIDHAPDGVSGEGSITSQKSAPFGSTPEGGGIGEGHAIAGACFTMRSGGGGSTVMPELYAL